MKHIKEAYVREVRVLRKRVAQLQKQLKTQDLPQTQQDETELRLRCLREEIYEMEHCIEAMECYLRAESAGDAVCAS